MTIQIAVAVVLVAAIFGLKFWLEAKARAGKGGALPELPPDIREAVRRRSKVLIYFFSPTCGHCRVITPVVDRLALGRDDIFKVDISQSVEFARSMGVMGTPTTMLLKGTTMGDVVVGPISESRLAAFLA